MADYGVDMAGGSVPMGPISQTAMPNFNILGLMLGGRSYASGWFQQRDQLQMVQAREAQQKQEAVQFAQHLQEDPKFAQAMDQPYDRRSQFGLWGAMQGGNENTRALGSNLLQDNINHIYAREGTVFDDELSKQRIRLTADEQLRVDQVGRDRDAAAAKANYDRLYGPDPHNPNVSGGAADYERTRAAKALGIDVPTGSIVGLNPEGTGLVMKPAPGTDKYAEVFGQMQTQQNMIEDASLLLGHYDGSANLSRGEYKEYRLGLEMAVKRAEELGTLDQGTSDKLKEILPDYGYTGSDMTGQAQEQLRVFVKQRERELEQVARRNMVPIDLAGGVKPPRVVPDSVAEKANKAKQQLRDDAGARQSAEPGPGQYKTRAGTVIDKHGPDDSIWGKQGGGSGRRGGN